MNRKSFGFLFLMILLCAQSISAATVTGNAFKDGHTDHSGITIHLETLHVVPATGFIGAGLLLGGLSLLLLRKRNRTAGAFGIVVLVSGLSCIGYAFATYTAVTNTDGSYSMTAVDPGDYRLDASAPGYFPEQLVPITIVDGPNALPTITLYPMGTPTPVPTNTPVFVSVGNMIPVSAGSFTQGSPFGEPCRDFVEAQFTHTLTRNLAVMETEITRQMWADLRAVQPTLPDDPSTLYSPTMSHPVQTTSWCMAVLFANLLSLQNGYTQCYYTDSGFTNPITVSNCTVGPFFCDFDAEGYRLPSEGEWEYFTRAGTITPFSCDETNYTESNCTSCTSGTHPVLEQCCWYCANSGYVGTQIAGSSLANPWNLKDVHGNVSEHCWDWYGTYPTGSATDYTGLTSGLVRIHRGGSYFHQAYRARSAFRYYANPNWAGGNVGFRLVRTCPYATPTPAPTDTPVPTDTPTMTPTETPTNTSTPTPVPTDTPMPTDTPVPTDTPMPTDTPVPTDTPTMTPTDTSTATPTRTPTNTPTNSPTDTPTNTPTNSPTDTPTNTPTETPTETPIPAGHLISMDNIVGNMRYVPAGTFTQGSPGTEPCRGSNETQFTHTLTRILAVMETEITRQMWADLKVSQPTLPNDPSMTSVSPTMNHPVQQITWYEAVLFANLLSLQNGYTRCYYKDVGFTTPVDGTNYTSGEFHCDFDANGYRLPSEGEWEYFCRAGTMTAFSTHEPNYGLGNCSTCSPSPALTVLDSIAWWCGNASVTAHPAGTKAANPWNLKDMHGNVLEWIWDRHSGTYPSGSATDYTGPASGSDRGRRGGSFNLDARVCRSALRGDGTPGGRTFVLGFRLVRVAP